MVVRTIEMLLEYVCIILCIHRVAKEKVRINKDIVFIFFTEWILTILVNRGAMSLPVKLLIYLSILAYTKRYVVKKWVSAIKLFTLMVVVIFSLQLFLLYIVTIFYNNEQYMGIVINALVGMLLIFWKEKYWRCILKRLSNKLGVAIIVFVYVLNLVKVLIICNKDGFINFNDSIQIWIEMIVLSVALIIWFNEEQKNHHNEKELQIYEVYNQTFEETIKTVRMRQHEFENHINAIRCMRYTIHDLDELFVAQEQYCEEILKENRISDLLKINLEPVLSGFLHAKIAKAMELGIMIECDIHPIVIEGKIRVYEMIELIGILFDNALEALVDEDNKKMRLGLFEKSEGVILEVANISKIFSNTEIEKFCSYGYSTKGDKRGVGLSRVKEITKKSNAILLIQNQRYNEENFLCFKVCFR